MASVEGFLDWIFAQAASGRQIRLPASVSQDVDAIFSSNIWGYREVLLTVLIAKWRDPEYEPTKDFYACHPRTLYEGPIREKLTALSVPRRKSGPLNVAKAAKALSPEWAQRRDDREAANAVVRMAAAIEKAPQKTVETFSIATAARFLELARRTAALYTSADPRADLAGLVSVCLRLMVDSPAGGATAQRIVGEILDVSIKEPGAIKGHHDAPSTTNTTSKKAGDLIVTFPDGTPRVIEVTQKAFNGQRMEDSYESVRAMDEAAGGFTSEVVVLCREQDVPDTAARSSEYHGFAAPYLGSVGAFDLTFEFVGLYAWVAIHLSTMTSEDRIEFHKRLSAYVQDPNTHPSVKVAWALENGDGD